MRIYKPQNEFGQDLLSNGDLVNSTKTITKAIADGKVEITAADLGTDKASDWTVLEVVFGGNKMMAGVASTDEKITVTLDDAGSAFSGDVTVTLTYESAMNITEDAQLPPVIQQGAFIRCDDEGNKIMDGKITGSFVSIYAIGPNADFTELVDGTSLFQWAGVTSFDYDLPALTDGTRMFSYCIKLTSFTGDLPALTNCDDMFRSCTSLTSWNVALPALTDGYRMFYGCKGLTSFNVELSALTSGQSMFYECAKLTNFNVDLPALENGNYMFRSCTSLTSWNVNLPALTSGTQMFYSCSGLTSFESDLSALTDGTRMFTGCKGLTSFEVDLPALTNGDNMFYNCNKLTSFSGDLSALTNGTSMFWWCKLDLDSVNRIANTINNLKSQGMTGDITIGVDSSRVTQAQQNAANTILVNKGWTVSWQRN